MACLGTLSAEVLIVSNYPEEIKEPGIVFKERLTTGNMRILYYHKGASVYPMDVHISLQNTSDIPVKVSVISSQAGPDSDGLFAGHKTTFLFMEKLKNKSEVSLTILPQSTLAVMTQKIKKGQVSSGLCTLRAQTSGNIQVVLAVVDPQNEAASLMNEVLMTKPYTYGYFNNPDFDTCALWPPEDPLYEWVIGDQPYLQDPLHHIELKGNYGAVYSCRVVLANTTDHDQVITLLASPVGGIARGCVEVDGTLLETGFFEHKTDFKPQKMYEWRLPAGHVRHALLKTMPQAGSFYPVHFVLRRDVAK